ncbi:MAG: hypothetical protein GQ570_11610 [Helicobacteraceae bacterium]|nr:hypothetical protein [Helicobacteraceae bacterium]
MKTVRIIGTGNPTVSEKACKITLSHVAILAKKFKVTNLIMFNSLLMGNFRDELYEVMGGVICK